MVFKDIAFYRPHDEPFLPNLRQLEWTTYYGDTAAAALLLVSPSVKSLNITVHDTVSPAGYKALIRNLGGRLSGVQELTIATTLPAGTVSMELAECIQTMPKLRKVELPQFYLYEDVLRAASQLQSLTSMKVSWQEQQVYDEKGMQFYFEQGWFQGLRAIQVDAYPRAFVAFLAASH